MAGFEALGDTWVDKEVEHLTGEDRECAKLILVVAKASWQFDESLAHAVMRNGIDEKRLIRILAFAAYSAAKRLAQLAGDQLRAVTSLLIAS